MTSSKSPHLHCSKAYETFRMVLRDVHSAIDELENALWDSGADSCEVAVSTIDSCLEDLEDQMCEYERAAGLCEGCGGCLEKHSVRTLDIKGARSATEAAVKAIQEILDEMPSDGEEEEEDLENLRSVAEEFLNEIRSYFE